MKNPRLAWIYRVSALFALALAAAAGVPDGLGPAPQRPAAVQPAPAVTPPRPAVDSLVILHTNDIHSHLFPFHRGTDSAFVGGAAARAALIDRERASDPDLLVLDGGDIVQGTPVYNLFRGVPDIQVMEAMRYDAAALGNHDLDDGPIAWKRLRPYRTFPVLSANVFVAADSAWAKDLGGPVPDAHRAGARWVGGRKVLAATRLRYLAEPYRVITWRGRRIALFGLTTGDLPNIVRIPVNRGVAAADPVVVARQLVPKLRAQADLVIALTHIGLDRDRELAERVPGIDLIVGGHSHTRLEEPVFSGDLPAPLTGGVPIVQAGSWGDRVGRTVLRLSGGRPAGASSRLLPVRPEDGERADITAMLRSVADSVDAAMSEVVYVSDAHYPQPSRNQVESPLGNFVADVARITGDADIGIVNKGGIRSPLPHGPVTVADIYSMLPFDNTIVVVPMRGSEVQRVLDFAARRIGKGGFAQVSGASFEISGDRAVHIRIGGRRLDPDATYRVATIDYLYEGGDGYTHFRKAGTPEPTGIFMNAAAASFLKRHPDYAFRTEGRIVVQGGWPGGDRR